MGDPGSAGHRREEAPATEKQHPKHGTISLQRHGAPPQKRSAVIDLGLKQIAGWGHALHLAATETHCQKSDNRML